MCQLCREETSDDHTKDRRLEMVLSEEELQTWFEYFKLLGEIYWELPL